MGQDYGEKGSMQEQVQLMLDHHGTEGAAAYIEALHTLAEKAEAEVERLRAKVAVVEGQRDDRRRETNRVLASWGKERDELRAERDAALAKVERLRALLERWLRLDVVAAPPDRHEHVLLHHDSREALGGDDE